jgi:hypothetical protein
MNNVFHKTKEKRKDGYFKDDSELLELIKPFSAVVLVIMKMSVPKIAKELNITPRKITWCIKKNNLDTSGKNYWQTNK